MLLMKDTGCMEVMNITVDIKYQDKYFKNISMKYYVVGIHQRSFNIMKYYVVGIHKRSLNI